MRRLVWSEDVCVPMSTWDNIKTWQYVLPPSRPSNEHLSCIRESIEQVDRSAPVAILGSTPEFRDLLYELGFTNVVVIDNNVQSFHQMSRLRAYDSKEHFIHGDWQTTLPTFHDHFALILSDLTIGNIPYEHRRSFYASLAESLADHGLFVDKILMHASANKRLADLERQYTLLPLNLLNVNYFSCDFFFCSELLDIAGIVDTTLFYDELTARFKNRKLQRFLELCELVTPRDCIWYYGRPWSQQKADYCADLSTVKIYEELEGSPYYQRLKLKVHEREAM